MLPLSGRGLEAGARGVVVCFLVGWIYRQFGRQQVQLEVEIHVQTPEPLGKLAEHQACRDVGTVDRRLCCAGARVGVLGGKERRRVVSAAGGI